MRRIAGVLVCALAFAAVQPMTAAAGPAAAPDGSVSLEAALSFICGPGRTADGAPGIALPGPMDGDCAHCIAGVCGGLLAAPGTLPSTLPDRRLAAGPWPATEAPIAPVSAGSAHHPRAPPAA